MCLDVAIHPTYKAPKLAQPLLMGGCKVKSRPPDEERLRNHRDPFPVLSFNAVRLSHNQSSSGPR